MSLQGPAPLPSYPSTLRDFSLSEVLTLPATFGSINLGETFTGSVCVNNDLYHPPLEAASVGLRVEMQTATSKVVIGEFGGQDSLLKPAATLETIVHHEIKELGQHVLACTVSYRIPHILVPTYPVPPEDPSDPTFRSFRKFYKFMVRPPSPL
jgi:trafficking protein particle complex subunit 13